MFDRRLMGKALMLLLVSSCCAFAEETTQSLEFESGRENEDVDGRSKSDIQKRNNNVKRGMYIAKVVMIVQMKVVCGKHKVYNKFVSFGS